MMQRASIQIIPLANFSGHDYGILESLQETGEEQSGFEGREVVGLCGQRFACASAVAEDYVRKCRSQFFRIRGM